MVLEQVQLLEPEKAVAHLSKGLQVVLGFQASNLFVLPCQRRESCAELAELEERAEPTFAGSACPDPAWADAAREACELVGDCPAATSCEGEDTHRAAPTKYRSAALAEALAAELARCPVVVLATARRGRWVSGRFVEASVAGRVAHAGVAALVAAAEQALEQRFHQKRKDCLQDCAGS